MVYVCVSIIYTCHHAMVIPHRGLQHLQLCVLYRLPIRSYRTKLIKSRAASNQGVVTKQRWVCQSWEGNQSQHTRNCHNDAAVIATLDRTDARAVGENSCIKALGKSLHEKQDRGVFVTRLSMCRGRVDYSPKAQDRAGLSTSITTPQDYSTDSRLFILRWWQERNGKSNIKMMDILKYASVL